MIKNLYVVGNKIKEHLEIENCISVSEFFTMLKTNKNIEPPVSVVFGQGISIEDRHLLLNTINNSSSYLTNHQLSTKNIILANKELIHKSKNQNVFITHPELIDDTLYKSSLYLDQDCDEMSDHITGRHIQGMVLIEAARQMCTAVAEEYWILKNKSTAFILEQLNAKFIDFMFYGNVDIELKAKKKRELLRGDFKAICEINFTQNNNVCLSVEIHLSTMEKTLFANIEKARAREFINTEVTNKCNSI